MNNKAYRRGQRINSKRYKKLKEKVARLLLVFLLTFSAVVTIGLLVILGSAAIKKNKSESYDLAKDSYGIEVINNSEADGNDNISSGSIGESDGASVEEDGDNQTAMGEDTGASEEVVDDSKYGSVISDENYLKENNIHLKEAAGEDEIRFGFIGDILLDDEYAVLGALIQRGSILSKGISMDTLNEMNAVDVLVVNNEFPFTNGGVRQENKKYTFRADTNTVDYLTQMGADVAILANNHVFDFGEQGLLDTLDTLASAEIYPVGAGRNFEEASRPVYYIINDIKIAIVAATQIERMNNPNTKGATESSPGVFRCWNDDRIYDAIREAKANADFVIACIHWGTEKDPQPDSYQLDMAPKLADAGADLIVGDHTHRLQGVYYYGDTPCIYSLGNFWFNGFKIDTGMYEVTIDKNGLKELRFLPAIQENYSTHLVDGSEKKRITDYLISLSKGANISEDGYITKAG